MELNDGFVVLALPWRFMTRARVEQNSIVIRHNRFSRYSECMTDFAFEFALAIAIFVYRRISSIRADLRFLFLYCRGGELRLLRWKPSARRWKLSAAPRLHFFFRESWLTLPAPCLTKDTLEGCWIRFRISLLARLSHDCDPRLSLSYSFFSWINSLIKSGRTLMNKNSLAGRHAVIHHAQISRESTHI